MEHTKNKSLDELALIIAEHKARGEVVVHCHGVFDLLHPGHFRYFQQAKQLGHKLVVTATADAYVNKGVGRPVFNQALRLEVLSAIQCIDYVALNEASDAIELIRKLKPTIYTKGIEYKDHDKDISGKIALEVRAVEEFGGRVHYTDDIVFSSTELLNTHFGQVNEGVKRCVVDLKNRYGVDGILHYIKTLASLKVLVVGDAIIDDYQYVDPLGQSGKGVHMVARCKEREIFAGGVFAVANHVANFTENVTMLTAISADDGSIDVIAPKLNPKIKCQYVKIAGTKTLSKKRYVLRDGNTLSKLFETYSGADNLIGKSDSIKVCNFIHEHGDEFDVILVSDFGNGFINRDIVQALVDTKAFLAINAQINSGNRGYNVVTHYPRADYISLNEGELRLTAHDKYGEIKTIVERVCANLLCNHMAVTRGVNGVLVYSRERGYLEIPALTQQAIDRVGAGDSYLAISSLCLAGNVPFDVTAFVGSAAAAIDVQIIGNKESVDMVTLSKYITTLMK